MRLMMVAVRYGACEVVSTVQALCLLTVVLAEPFYQRRDHLDQERYRSLRKNKNIVRDSDDAKLMLSKYGYLQCQVERRKRETRGHGQGGDSHPDSSRGATLDRYNLWGENSPLSGEGGIRPCDESEVQQALREYQKTYNLMPTGILDEDTKRVMSASRCGNKDNGQTLIDRALPTKRDQPVSSSSSSSSSPSGPSSKQDESDLLNKVGEAQRLWKRAIKRIRSNDPSYLLRMLKGAAKAKHTEESRHRRYLQDYISRLPRRDPILLRPWSERERSRSKRSIQVTATGDSEELKDFVGLQVHENQAGDNMSGYDDEGEDLMFAKNVLRWRLLESGYSTTMPVAVQRATIQLAFRMWSEVIPLQFVEDLSSELNDIDIEIAFGRGEHQNCHHAFDGLGGELAHSEMYGDMHFDDEETYKTPWDYHRKEGIYLLRVAVHEIGHVLGLAHTNSSQSIMYAIYHGSGIMRDFELSREDRRMVQRIHGVCKGEFNTVFDWVRMDASNGNRLIYNTYFFRDNHYWMYENYFNRTRYGDPLLIAPEWDGVPNKVDGFLHLWFPTDSGVVNQSFFFRGEHYYKYNSAEDRVYNGWPRLIQDDFGPKPGQTVGIPNNLDSVFFDMRDRNIYFFKGDMVYVYDPKEPEESRGCCVRRRRFLEEFPSAPLTPSSQRLENVVDAVYYSNSDRAQYFFKGEDLWRNRLFNASQSHVVNCLEYVGKWYDKYFDICEVGTY